MTNAYRDEMESLRARAEKLEDEAKSREAELDALRARLAERDALFERLRVVAGATPRRRVWPVAVAGAIALSALGAGAFLRGKAAAGPVAPAQRVAAAALAEPESAAPAPAQAAPEWGPLPQVTSCGASYVAILHEGGAVECLDGQPGRLGADILEEPDGTSRLIIDGQNARSERIVTLYGGVRTLPGELNDMHVRVVGPGRSERESTSSRVRVTKFGAVGERAEGEAFATMVPRLNERPEQLHVVFSVVRGPDRHGP